MSTELLTDGTSDSGLASVATPPNKEYDDQGNLKVRLSSRAVATLKQLDGFQSIKADKMLTGTELGSMAMFKIYALFALQSLTIGGVIQALPPTANDLQVYRRASLMSDTELIALSSEYVNEFMIGASEDDLKNS
jgi:hypothetical protein